MEHVDRNAGARCEINFQFACQFIRSEIDAELSPNEMAFVFISTF